MNIYKEYHTNVYATRIQNYEPLKVTVAKSFESGLSIL